MPEFRVAFAIDANAADYETAVRCARKAIADGAGNWLVQVLMPDGRWVTVDGDGITRMPSLGNRESPLASERGKGVAR